MYTLKASFNLLIMGFLFSSIMAFSQQPDRTILIEEFTGEWCGWCPIGMMGLENMIERFGDSVIVVAVHMSDPFESPSAGGMIGVWGGAAPTALINRAYDTLLQDQVFSPEDWEEVIARQINTPAPCNVSLDYTFDDTSREIMATVSATFTEDFVGDARLNLYIVEDSVIGVSQSNYLSGNPAFINTPFYELPEHIDNFPHEHLLREMVGESYGIDGVIPDTVYSGQQFHYVFHYTVPEEFNLEKLHLIGIAQQYKGLKKYRTILNSVHHNFDYTVGIDKNAQISPVTICPIPVKNIIHIKMNNSVIINKVQVFSIDGKMVFSGVFNSDNLEINSENIQNGYYLIHIISEKSTYHQKIVVCK
ncbi:MAG: Omp28-related outer membrane protein [Bacteroidales bacterium]|nr:Omp28-related outer membrane protein [Bacteroidales bacterium]